LNTDVESGLAKIGDVEILPEGDLEILDNAEVGGC
jgi:hypothetical protein